MFTETNPDKGTETIINCYHGILDIMFTETNPDKGTETITVLALYKSDGIKFTETNPDKGTETYQ